MPWKGYNFEDAIVISERMMRDDIFTSVHVDEYIMEVRDTKRGVEELTSDIPNVSEDATKDLDENGIIRIGANIKPGDILIGKITPKGESDPSPEEKLLRAIFGDKAGDVKDASLKAQPSLFGVVVDKKLFSRPTVTAKRAKPQKRHNSKSSTWRSTNRPKSCAAAFSKTGPSCSKTRRPPVSATTSAWEIVAKGTRFTQKMLGEIDFLNVAGGQMDGDAHLDSLVEKTINNYIIKYKEADAVLKRDKYNLTNGDELPAGIIQLAKVYIAKKRKLRVGDKMAGRHGNKGIVAKVVRDEDMPFLEDGSIVDIVLNRWVCLRV